MNNPDPIHELISLEKAERKIRTMKTYIGFAVLVLIGAAIAVNFPQYFSKLRVVGA